ADIIAPRTIRWEPEFLQKQWDGQAANPMKLCCPGTIPPMKPPPSGEAATTDVNPKRESVWDFGKNIQPVDAGRDAEATAILFYSYNRGVTTSPLFLSQAQLLGKNKDDLQLGSLGDRCVRV